MPEIGDAEINQPQDDGAVAEDAAPAAALRAHTFVRNWGSASDPVALLCDGGEVYVVKARHNGRPEIARMMVAERVVCSIGRVLGAPVPEVAFVEVPAELVAAQPELANFISGIAHGAKFIANTTERDGINHAAEAENRVRFARLAVLFGWAHGADHQFIYEKTPPHRVYSHDHGHFLPGGPNWSVASLTQHDAHLDAVIAGGCNLTPVEINEAIVHLKGVVPADIERVVAGVP